MHSVAYIVLFNFWINLIFIQSIPMPGAGRPTATEGGGGGDGQPSRTASTREQWSSPNMVDTLINWDIKLDR